MHVIHSVWGPVHSEYSTHGSLPETVGGNPVCTTESPEKMQIVLVPGPNHKPILGTVCWSCKSSLGDSNCSQGCKSVVLNLGCTLKSPGELKNIDAWVCF